MAAALGARVVRPSVRLLKPTVVTYRKYICMRMQRRKNKKTRRGEEESKFKQGLGPRYKNPMLPKINANTVDSELRTYIRTYVVYVIKV